MGRCLYLRAETRSIFLVISSPVPSTWPGTYNVCRVPMCGRYQLHFLTGVGGGCAEWQKGKTLALQSEGLVSNSISVFNMLGELHLS